VYGSHAGFGTSAWAGRRADWRLPTLKAGKTMNTPPLALGANGRFGAAAVQAYAAAGFAVLAQVRRAPAQPLPGGAHALTLPLQDTAGLAAAAAGARVVVHALNPAYTRWTSELMPLARLGMDVAERLRARFMLPGNVYNFGPGMPPLLQPGTPQPGGTEKGQQRCALEAELQQRAQDGRLRATVLRAGDFYGAGRGNWFDMAIVKDLARGRLVYPGPLDVTHAWAFLPDLARAFALLAGRGQAPDFEHLLFPGHALTGRELLSGIEAAAQALGLQAAGGWRHRTLPWGLIRTAGLVVPAWRELARMRYLWQVPHALDGSALAAALPQWRPVAVAPALQHAVAALQPHRPLVAAVV